MNKYHARGGRADIRNKIWRSAQWQRTRKIVLVRDNYTCCNCGAHPVNSVHHIDPITQLIEEGRNPFDPDECETLCVVCHGIKDKRRADTAKKAQILGGGIRRNGPSVPTPLTQLRKNAKVGQPRGNRFLTAIGVKNDGKNGKTTEIN